MTHVAQSGFTAVELLITLFIGVAFIGAGYQLYGVAVKDGSDVRMRAQASSIAYSQLRTSAAGVSNPCATSTTTIPVLASTGLINASMTAAISCPYGATSPVSTVTVTLSYGTDSPQKQVSHAIYATKP
jgi:prepilin-type N-terminal cleavage/methylation domain-containing protein